MGAKRKVSEMLYKQLKKELKTPKDDKKVMKKYNLGQTAVRAVRNSWCYADYLARTSHSKKSAKGITLNSPRRPKEQVQEQAFKAWAGFMFVFVLAMFVALFLVVRWVLSWFGV